MLQVGFEFYKDLGVEGSIAIFAIGACVKSILASGDLRRILRDYPPHRHVNGSILYPSGMEPSEIGHLGGDFDTRAKGAQV